MAHRRASSGSAAMPAGSDLTTAVDRAIAAFGGDVGFFARNLVTGETVGRREDAVMPTASTIKVCVLCELYRQADAGEVDVHDRMEMTEADLTGGSGVLDELEPGLRPTLQDLARLMTVVSDNVATGMLVRRLGRERINATMRGWGLADTVLLDLDADGDIRRYALSTPRQLARLMELIATDAVLTPAACAAVRDHLARQQYLDQIPRYLPFNPWADDLGDAQPLRVMNKTGFYTGVRVDAAILQQGAVSAVVATMTEGSADPSFSAEHEGLVVNGRLGRAVYDAWFAGA